MVHRSRTELIGATFREDSARRGRLGFGPRVCRRDDNRKIDEASFEGKWPRQISGSDNGRAFSAAAPGIIMRMLFSLLHLPLQYLRAGSAARGLICSIAEMMGRTEKRGRRGYRFQGESRVIWIS